MKDISDHGPEIQDVLRQAQKLQETYTPSEKTTELARQAAALEADWEEVNVLANQRAQQVDESMRHAVAFKDQLDHMLLWLQLKEDKLKDITPTSLDKNTVAKKLKDAQVSLFF